MKVSFSVGNKVNLTEEKKTDGKINIGNVTDTSAEMYVGKRRIISPTPIKEVNNVGSSISLEPNIYYKLPKINALTINFISHDKTVVEEYMGYFIAGDSVNITWPTGVRCIGKSVFIPGYTYEFSVANNLGIIIEYAS